MQILPPSSAAIKRHVWPIGLLTPGLNLDLALSNCCLLPQRLANFTEQDEGNVILEGLQQLLDGNTAISHAPKPSKRMLLESKLGPAARCAASVNHPVALRCHMSLIGVIARVFLCSWVYQHVSLCPKLNRFWLAGEPAWSCRRRGRKARPLARLPLVMEATQTRTVL